MVVHNRTRDAHCVAFRTVAQCCRIVVSADNVLFKPTGLPRWYPRKRPAAVALPFTHKLFQILGIDFIIVGTPKAVASINDQKSKNSSNLRRKEIIKWRGAMRTNLTKPMRTAPLMTLSQTPAY
uniref:Uncharacterized protein n=1 Tax=Odontella aurita TaxID=265563 RepID=A0A7S4HIT7_9STRA